MSTVNESAYQRLVDEDLQWLSAQPRSLERDHIEVIIRQSVATNYPQPPSRPEEEADVIALANELFIEPQESQFEAIRKAFGHLRQQQREQDARTWSAMCEAAESEPWGTPGAACRALAMRIRAAAIRSQQ